MSTFNNKSYFKIKTSSERSFGFAFAIFFTIISLFPLWYGENIRLWACIIAFIFLFFGIFLPKALTVPNKLWLKLGLLLGAIVAPIVMGIIFFLTVTPTGIIMRLLGRRTMNQRIKKPVKSYWIQRKKIDSSMKNQF